MTKKVIIIILIIIPFLRYFPLNFNESLNIFFYNYSYLISFIILISGIVIYFIKKSRLKFLLIILTLAQVLLNPIIQNFCNHIIIKINSKQDIENFRNPILGVKMEKNINDATFKYDNFFSYKLLVFKKEHGITKTYLNNNFELHGIIKVYNNDWYLEKID